MNTALHAPQPAQILDGYVKMRFLPMLFAGDFMRAELNIYQYADRFLSDYDGGVWEFAQLPGGGGFMKPEGEARWHFSNPGNYSELDVSAEAAGIIITALVLNHRSWMYDRHDEEELCAHYCERHRQLMNYAGEHHEADAIFRALD
ncbi:antirestriction protein [Pantoea dispersa]|uniref:antirestriction protein n=1 Tax=Pantoea dispersa TaxID=59814 RepID=UPI000FDC2109|nr:antirestriction protein [Pantoea dispersa]MCT6592598.1 antirestriction protein [Pantoea dispersa]RVU71962.1 antirestriction protein [Pantoea dispersa]